MAEIQSFRLASDSFWSMINDRFDMSGGVYLLYCMGKKGNPVSVQRLLDVDKMGVLYIGKADSFLDRVIALKKSISPKYESKAHACGVRYKENPNIAALYPYDSLYVTLLPSEQPDELEKQELEKYFLRFGEVPPLNAIR